MCRPARPPARAADSAAAWARRRRQVDRNVAAARERLITEANRQHRVRAATRLPDCNATADPRRTPPAASNLPTA